MYFKKFIFFFFIIFSSNYLNSSELTVLETIENKNDLSQFYKYLKMTGLDKILNKKLPWDWTIFAPNNKAFKNFDKNKFLNQDNDYLIKNLLMDHILVGRRSSQNLNNNVITEKTVSNKPIELYKSNEIHVKDMIVINEDVSASNGIIHSIDCIMFVQPSEDDDRLSPEIKKKFSITSCCMREDNEFELWKESVKSR